MDECRRAFEEWARQQEEIARNRMEGDDFVIDASEMFPAWQAAWNRRAEAEQKPVALSREDIIRMASAAGVKDNGIATRWFDDWSVLERFASIVATAYGEQVKEACAKDCDAAADRLSSCPASIENSAAISALRHRADAIRQMPLPPAP